MFDPISHPWRRPIIQRNLQLNHLHRNHNNRLRKQRHRVIRAEPVEHPISSASPPVASQRGTHFKIDATSMINGISNENPADVLDLCMLYIWSAYDVNGAVTRLQEPSACESHHFQHCTAIAIVKETYKIGAAWSNTSERRFIASEFAFSGESSIRMKPGKNVAWFSIGPVVQAAHVGPTGVAARGRQ